MIALRYVYVVALAIWVGGLITIGSVVAPSAFAVVEALGGPQPLAAVLVFTLLLMKVVGPRPPGFGARLVLVSAMLGVTLVTGFWVDPQIASMRSSVGVPIATLAPDDARRVRFGQLHGLSTALMAATALAGLVLCYWETRE